MSAALNLEFHDGAWTSPTEAEPDALITYATEPSPETGHVGWCWWARGKMGDAATLEEAKAKAEAAFYKACLAEVRQETNGALFDLENVGQALRALLGRIPLWTPSPRSPSSPTAPTRCQASASATATTAGGPWWRTVPIASRS